MKNNEMIVGAALALLATVIWAVVFVVARLVAGHVPPLAFGAAQWSLALLVLCAFAFSQVRREWPVAKIILPRLIAASLFGVAAYAPLSYFAAQTTSAINLSLISVTTPVFIILLSALGGQRQSFHTWVGCIVALFGSVYLVSNGDLGRLWVLEFASGDLLMLTAAVGFAVYSILIKDLPEGLSQTTVLILLSLFAVVMLVPFVVWESLQPGTVYDFTPVVFFALIFCSICASIIGWWSWNLGIGKAGAEVAGMIYYSLPLWGGVLAYFFLGEQMTSVHIVANILIIGGIIWSTRGAKPKAVAAAEH